MGYAIAAYSAWGLFPIYFKWLASVPPTEVILHRAVWSLLFLLIIHAVRRQWQWLVNALRRPAVLASIAMSTTALTINWFGFIWAVQNDHVVDASLGYFINPLVTVLMGVLILHERLHPVQWVAVGVAALGVTWLSLRAGGVPWVALVLALSFASYGLLRKIAPVGSLEGLTLETLLLSIPAVIVLAWLSQIGSNSFASADLGTRLLLIGAGPATAVPLLLFAAGARGVTLATVGILQYIAPSLQFLLGVWLYGEPFDAARGIGFALVWTALAIYATDAILRSRQPRPAG
jgi:chloramphenicol-sensitive protein RarD